MIFKNNYFVLVTESIASRLSLASLGRLSIGSGKHLQDTLSVFQNNLDEFSGILGKSESFIIHCIV